MARRNLLHVNKLNAFRDWLVEQGYTILPLDGDFEVLRAHKPQKGTLLVFKRLDAKEHYSLRDSDTALVRQFLNDERHEKTNGERLKSLMIEEIAHAICYKGLFCGSSSEICAEGSEHFKREAERWIKWLSGTDPRHQALWEVGDDGVS